MATVNRQLLQETGRERADDRVPAVRRVPWLLLALAVTASAAAAVAGAMFGYELVVGAALIGVVLALAFARSEFATQVVFFVLYSNLTVILVNRGIPSEIAGSFFLLLGVPLLNFLFVKRQGLVITPIFIIMIGYLGVLILSAAFAESPRASYSRITSYVIEGLALYFLVINTVRTEALLRKVIWMTLLAGMVMGSVTLYQGVTGSYDNDFGGWAQVTQSETSIGEEDFFGNQPTAPRLAGPIGEKNRYAQVLVVLLPLAIGRIWAEKSAWLRLLAAAAIVPIVGGALLTFSRGAGVGLIITLVALMLMRMAPVRHVLILSAVVALVGFGLVPGYLYRLTNLNISSIFTGDVSESDTSVQGRMTQYLTATYMIRDNLILGVGPGQTQRYITEYARGVGFKVLDENRRMHNMYLEEMSDTGIVGFAVLMSIIGATMLRLAHFRYRYRQTRPDIYYTASSLLLSIIAYLSTAMFLHLAYIRYFWVLMALAGAAIAVWTRLLEVAPPQRNALAQPDTGSLPTKA